MSRGQPSSIAGINVLGNDRYLDVETGEEMSGEALLKRMGGAKMLMSESKEQSMDPVDRLGEEFKNIWRFMGILPKKRRGGFAR